jgi:hypothetical protein
MLSTIGYMIHAMLVDLVLGFHQILYFALSCSVLKFWHLKQAISRKFDILKGYYNIYD